MKKPDLKAARQKPQYQIAPEDVVEPELSGEDRADFAKGVEFFNRGEYWESHEAWEMVWRRHPEPSRIFYQGLIQLAAAYHQLHRGIHHGVVKHFNNAEMKLVPFSPRFLNVNVEVLVAAIRSGRAEAERLREQRIGEFDRDLITKVEVST